MKLLVFAHKPPPYHGQSYAVQLMLEGFGGDVRQEATASCVVARHGIECYHVDCRFSEDLQDLGRAQFRKALLILKYCLQAIWCRLRHGAKNFYYVPAPSLRAPLYRDWVVMLLCRPFFRRTIFHWHAAGLAEWLESRAKPWERWLSRRLLGQAHLSVVLSQFNRRDAELLAARACKIVPNGIPDPCPDFDKVILPRRQARLEARRRILAGEIPTKAEREAAGGDPQLFHVLFLSLCTREKGLFDALDAVALLNQKLAAGDTGVRVKLEVAGEFHTEADRAEFAERIARPDLHLPWINHPASNETASPTGGFSAVEYCGFVSGPAKQRLFGRTDAFCFPTYYQAESFGIVLVEAMAFGVPIVTTRWRAVPELFPATYPGLVEPRRPDKVAAVLETFLQGYDGTSLRSRFLENYTLKQYLDGLAEAFRCVAAE